ncbi:MAG: hypothetical protein A2W97_02460 [Bacteroidetes bacterium GWE2_40_63]|nr:MAG: hypothetical protein A2W84_10985 [Bacteroidetes bacterium GWC2_40_13]OFX75909.1 MAG: hypothetical protein A2W96_03575 [Bacteroidetes bacterium GWD2_40_43]OFX90612.1 MAG: hypothetical protein A2W97_02460 [Bacteroidetes bacterium GWE2_40_63]OFY20910.1 MAG: hypothetical protein A2W88_17800 [Bacteroidetes bacterium GWF2_40_13]OFZ23670.1 MAG: hypothetical protein A2437_06430 [Bacteroidetes bacterium RIFOXYC2_FULL_40_12]
MFMNKKNLRYLILVLLVILVLVVVATQNKSTIKKELRDFAVEDTALVDKIFLVDKENQSILLERTTDHWVLNSEYVARQDLVNILLKTMYRIQVKEPVAKAAQENIIKSLAVKSTKVEIYQKGKRVKVYYVGGPTQDSYGTYMIIENSSSPFVVEIPGFRGYLSTRFSTLEYEWKAQTVFAISLEHLQEVTVENLKNKKSSFQLTHWSNHFELFSYPEKEPIHSFDTLKAKKYLMEFRKKNYSKYIEDVPMEYLDSIKNSPPVFVITAKMNNGNTIQMKAFNKPGWGRLDFFGQEIKNDPDNFFLLLNDKEFVYAQYFVFDPLFVGRETFLKE